MIDVEAKNLGDHIGKRFVYNDVILGQAVSDTGVIVSLRPIEDLFGLGDLVLEYEDEDGELCDFLVHGRKTFQIVE